MQLTAERSLGAVTLAAVGAAAVGLVCAPIEMVPLMLAGAAGIGLFAGWAVLGDLLTATLVWFLAVICFDEEFWRVSVPFFFNITISRLLIVVLAALWATMWALGRTRFRSTGWALPLMGMMAVYFTASAVVTGFESVAVATVHYRLIGGYWFAIAIFFFVLHGVRSERHIVRVLVFFAVIGAYLTFTGWCEQFEAWSLVFPQYIRDPMKGIHWGRVRGPFLVSPTMGLALVFCYFNNLLLARQVKGPLRWVVYGLCAAVLPAIFWTQTRSVWLGWILGAIVWTAYTRRRWSRAAAICVLSALALVATTINIENIMSQDRTRGGVTDMTPIYVRIGLAMITWDMFTDYPVAGVGFGHFRDVAPQYARAVDSPYHRFAASAMGHNNLLSLLAETGIIGLALYLALLCALLRLSLDLYRKLPGSACGPVGRDLVVLYWVLFVMYMVDGMFRETSVHPFTNSLFFGISGLMAALAWLLRPQPIRPRAGSTAVPATGIARRSPQPAAGWST